MTANDLQTADDRQRSQGCRRLACNQAPGSCCLRIVRQFFSVFRPPLLCLRIGSHRNVIYPKADAVGRLQFPQLRLPAHLYKHSLVFQGRQADAQTIRTGTALLQKHTKIIRFFPGLAKNHRLLFSQWIALIRTVCKRANIRTDLCFLFSALLDPQKSPAIGQADIRTDVLFQKARRNRQVITDAVIIQSLQHAAVPPFSTSSLS